MRRNVQAAAVVLALFGCSRDESTSEESVVDETAVVVTDELTAGRVRAALTASAPVTANPRLSETAVEYIARRGDTAPFEPGEIASSAVGAVPTCVICHGAASTSFANSSISGWASAARIPGTSSASKCGPSSRRPS